MANTSQSDEGSVGKRLFVAGLAPEVTPAIITASFVAFGELKSVELPLDPKSDGHRGFAFVEFEEDEDAQHAIDNMHLSELLGKVIRVGLARQSKFSGSSKSQPVWAEDFYYRLKLAEEGIEIDEEFSAPLPKEEEIQPGEKIEPPS